MAGFGNDRDPLALALGSSSVLGGAAIRALQGIRSPGLAGAFDATSYSSGTLGSGALPRLNLPRLDPTPPPPEPSWFTPQRRPNTLGGEWNMPPPPPPPRQPAELHSYTATGRDIFFDRLRSFGIPERQANMLASMAWVAPTGRAFEGGREIAAGFHNLDIGRVGTGALMMAPPWFGHGSLPGRRPPTPPIPTDILERDKRLRTMLPSETVDRILRRPAGPDPRGGLRLLPGLNASITIGGR